MITRIWSSLCIYFVTFFLSHLLHLLADNFSVCLPLTPFPGSGLLSFTFIPLLDLPFLSSLIFCIGWQNSQKKRKSCKQIQLPFFSLCIHEFYSCYLFFLFWHSCSDNDFSVIDFSVKKNPNTQKTKKEVTDVIFPTVINLQNHSKMLYNPFISIFWSILWKLFLMDIREINVSNICRWNNVHL